MTTVKLILLSMPIGNRQDLSSRAVETLREETLFVAEDTRTLKSVFNWLEISLTEKKIQSFHDHSQETQAKKMLEEIPPGENLVYVSEAGSPVISDPGLPLVQAAIELGIEVTTIPGASAVIAALELSGLAPIPFHFHGFFPRDKRESALLNVTEIRGTHIYFESPKRIMKTLEVIADVLPAAKVVVARELTKKFEEVYRFIAQDFSSIAETITLKGEFVLLIQANLKEIKKVGGSKEAQELAQNLIENGVSDKQLSKLLATLVPDKSAKEIYKCLQSRKN